MDKLCHLLFEINEIHCYILLAEELGIHTVPPFHPNSGICEILRIWLSRKPSWNELTSALTNMGYDVLAASIKSMCTCS